MTRRALKLVHTSDVHLESYFGEDRARSEERSRAERAFRRVVDLVREEGADLFLIAGDLFDSNRVEGAAVELVWKELARVTCPVFLTPGNHDCYEDGSIYRRVDFARIGPHVRVLLDERGESVELSGLDATIWARGLVDHEPTHRPLGGVPERSGELWHLGMAHGFVVDRRIFGRSSLITQGEIAACGLDYLALGHVHVFRDESQGATRACYPGTPVPLHRGLESGGSVAVVTLDPERGVRIEERRIFD